MHHEAPHFPPGRQSHPQESSITSSGSLSSSPPPLPPPVTPPPPPPFAPACPQPPAAPPAALSETVFDTGSPFPPCAAAERSTHRQRTPLAAIQHHPGAWHNTHLPARLGALLHPPQPRRRPRPPGRRRLERLQEGDHLRRRRRGAADARGGAVLARARQEAPRDGILRVPTTEQKHMRSRRCLCRILVHRDIAKRDNNGRYNRRTRFAAMVFSTAPAAGPRSGSHRGGARRTAWNIEDRAAKEPAAAEARSCPGGAGRRTGSGAHASRLRRRAAEEGGGLGAGVRSAGRGGPHRGVHLSVRVRGAGLVRFGGGQERHRVREARDGRGQVLDGVVRDEVREVLWRTRGQGKSASACRRAWCFRRHGSRAVREVDGKKSMGGRTPAHRAGSRRRTPRTAPPWPPRPPGPGSRAAAAGGAAGAPSRGPEARGRPAPLRGGAYCTGSSRGRGRSTAARCG